MTTAKNICVGCSNADSLGLPDKPVCKSCTGNSKWEPLTASSVNPIEQAQHAGHPKIYTFAMRDTYGDNFEYSTKANSEKQARSIAELACDDATAGKLLSVKAQQTTYLELPIGKAVSCKCAVCGEWQRSTESGMVCKNGHGGVIGNNHRTFTADQMHDRAAIDTSLLRRTSEESKMSERPARRCVTNFGSSILRSDLPQPSATGAIHDRLILHTRRPMRL